MPDVTPIVNVALVLLIVFMVVMPMIQEGIIVETPKAKNAEEIVEQLGEESLVLAIQEDGSLFINLHQVARADLKKELAQAYHGKEGKPVIIKGAKNLPYQEILELMEICQGVGAPGVDLMAKKQ
jgi:biopolymer transport protein TolR